MIKRIWVVLLLIGLFPMIFLLPVWGIVWIISGRFYLAEYMIYILDDVMREKE
jgi:hypothetical protein